MSESTDRRQFLIRAIRFGSLYSLLGRIDSQAAFGATAGRAARNLKRLKLTPEQEEGPFFIDHAKVRRDITDGSPGVPLLLQIKIVDADGRALPRCAVDLWHCDASGVYSGGEPTDNERYLRGVQLTDHEGTAYFETVYPGWYDGRAVHIHLKAHVGGSCDRDGSAYNGGHVAHTGQLYLSEAMTDRVMQEEPYVRHRGRRVLQKEDHLFNELGSSACFIALKQLDTASVRAGLVGCATVVISPNTSAA